MDFSARLPLYMTGKLLLPSHHVALCLRLVDHVTYFYRKACHVSAHLNIGPGVPKND